MAYSDQKFYTRVQHIVSPAQTWGTATASGATGHDTTGVVKLPKFERRTAVNQIRIRCTTIPNAASTAVVARFLNGTNTFGTAVLTTAASGGHVDATMTVANTTFAADDQPTVNLVGTSTASAAANGAYEVFFETQELFS